MNTNTTVHLFGSLRSSAGLKTNPPAMVTFIVRFAMGIAARYPPVRRARAVA